MSPKATTMEKYRSLLVKERERIMSAAENALRTDFALSKDDLADDVDLTVSERSRDLDFRLRDRERQLLGKISDALRKIEEGSFGVCEECEENIEPRRLEARPVSTLCIACKERQERSEKVFCA